MKRIGISLIIFICIVALTMISVVTLGKKHQLLTKQLELCTELAENQDQALQEQNKKLLDLWEKSQQPIFILTKRDHTELLSMSMGKLDGYAKSKQYDLYLAECQSIKEGLGHIIKGDRLSFEVLL